LTKHLHGGILKVERSAPWLQPVVESTSAKMSDETNGSNEPKEIRKPLIAKAKTYEKPTEDTHTAEINEVKDLGMVKSDLYGEQPKVRVSFKILDEKGKTGDDLFVFSTFTNTLGKKARLAAFLRQLGLATTGEFNLYDLEGMKVNANIIYNTSGGIVYANVESVSRVRKPGGVAPATEI
jgi:hypothetical protein